MWRGQHSLPAQNSDQTIPALVVSDTSPIGLIGTVTALGTDTLTIEGQPPGNTSPVRLEVEVDTRTAMTKVGPAPSYATSTALFADFKVGMLLSIEAAGVTTEGGVRHAERIIVPPPAE